MGKVVTFILGIITGLILSCIIAKSQNSDSNSDSISMFEERGQVMTESSFKIFQTLNDTHALATGISNEEYGWYMGLTVMIVGNENDHFYDDQIIKKTSTKRFYQVGTYKYQTKSEDFKTVPVVALLNIK
ncbi:MAG: hypothetical protein IJO23_02945 [Bacteroidales bacterium]|nr:hypothetical protein [Bacteroidales bacterium]